MSDERIIQQADLSQIASNLKAVHNELNVLDNRVGNVSNSVNVVHSELGSLAKEFHAFVLREERQHRLGRAETHIVQIRQELEKKYGHYDDVRRSTLGILQADDLGIVRKDTINNATEEMMISTPGYWLAPALVALAAWISNQPELAERALREAIKRNDEKTSLFFALICRRAGRKDSCLKWTQRYLAGQDEENLDRKTIIILDAFASGLLGADTEGVISRQMNEWLAHLEEKPGFVEKQTEQWSNAINSKRKKINDSSYTYLRKYSKTWPVLQDILEGAHLHAEMFNYLSNIFEQESSSDTVKEQLDEILNSLVTDYDDEELPLRKKEKLEQYVIDFGGDEDRAQKKMQVEKTIFETHKDFTQLLTDAAMRPESTHSSVSTQKFAFSLSKDWVMNAYNDVVAQNRMKIPNEINITVDNFNDKTKDGKNENELIGKFDNLVESEKISALAQCVMTSYDKFCFPGGIVIAIIGLLLLAAGIGLIPMIVGIGMVIHHNSKKKAIAQQRQAIEENSHNKRVNGEKIIRATLAEVVDFRIEFSEKDGESQKVIDFLEQITPEQYVKKLANSNRRIKM